MTLVDDKLNEILEKLAVSKVDNSFVLGLSFLSILFSLSNLVLINLLHRQILMIGAFLYFLSSFYVGYFRGVIRDNWGFRILGWALYSLSTGVILAGLITLLLLEAGVGVTLLPFGLSLLFGSTAIYLMVKFINDLGIVIPDFEKRILAISPPLMHYVSPFVSSFIPPHSPKPTYVAVVILFGLGVILVLLNVFFL